MSSDTPVQKPGTGVTNTSDKHEGGNVGGGPATNPVSNPAAAPATETQSTDPGIRPVTLPSGVHVISGPVPTGTKGAGPGNTAGTPGFGFDFHGTPGGGFTINGAGFNQYGDVYVDGTQVTVTAWSDNKIKGQLPAGVDVNGEVRVVDGTGTVQTGPTNRKAAVAEISTKETTSREVVKDVETKNGVTGDKSGTKS